MKRALRAALLVLGGGSVALAQAADVPSSPPQAARAAPAQTPEQDSGTLTLDEARLLARQALYAGRFEVARQLAMGLLKADAEDPYAYGVLAAAHSRLNDPKLARAAARLSYKYSDTPAQKFGAARTAASVALQHERPTLSQAWLRIAATHTETDKQEAELKRDYARARAANPLSFNISLGVAPSDNVNSGTDNVLEVINGVPTLGRFGSATRALSGVVTTFDTRLRYRLRRDANSVTHANARLYIRRVELSESAEADAPGVNGSLFSSTFAEVGVNHRFALGAKGNSASVGFALGASWSGGERSYDFAKLELGRSLRLGDANGLSFSAVAETRKSDISATRDSDVLTLSGTFQHKRGNGDRVSLGLTVQDVSGAFVNADYQTTSARLAYTFGKALGPATVTAGMTVGLTDYDTYTLYSPVAGGREDVSYYGDVSLFFKDYDYAGFAPTVRVRSGRRTSNVNRFEISETTVTLGLQSKF
ncbi:surface lipoprotein assembly modifier [uncultured Tateyamaria sp.]|uniref:surface lipoprotein assembly modifier n=1 Tax=Tateyamaria sp. 1078 TaxID=3417464 RepID=UPI0026199A65|nr:surface lipoprotein assembly modifier [uncultured Tateyamaria sp.]